MSSYDTRKFEYDDKDYEIRISQDGSTFRVRVYVDGKPANGYTYSVAFITHVNANISGSFIKPLEELIKTAENDVKSGVWESYLKAVEKLKDTNV